MKFFDDDTGETIANDFPDEYWNNIRQLAHDLTASQGGYDEESLIVVMGYTLETLPNGWNEFASNMMDLAPTIPKNTKQRHQEIQKLAFEILEGVDVTGAYPFRPLAKELSKRANCHLDTAKRNLAKAARRMRHPDWKPEWGGSREGAGRPVTGDSDDTR